jgi:hypothetical protein
LIAAPEPNGLKEASLSIFIYVDLFIACVCLDMKTWEAGGNAQKKNVAAERVSGRGDDSLRMRGIESEIHQKNLLNVGKPREKVNQHSSCMSFLVGRPRWLLMGCFLFIVVVVVVVALALCQFFCCVVAVFWFS